MYKFNIVIYNKEGFSGLVLTDTMSKAISILDEEMGHDIERIELTHLNDSDSPIVYIDEEETLSQVAQENEY